MELLFLLLTTFPRITVFPDTHNFGKIGWENVSFSFLVINQGDDTLKIYNVRTSCKCTEAKIENTFLLPGDSTKLIVHFSPGSHKITGNVKREISIHSNDPENPVKKVFIQAKVIPSNKDSQEFDYKELPDFAFRSKNILEAYKFVFKNKEFVQNFICYCGCDIASQHKSLKDCYIIENQFEDHASNCDVCIKEILDVIKMKENNKDIEKISSMLEEKYKIFHPEKKDTKN